MTKSKKISSQQKNMLRSLSLAVLVIAPTLVCSANPAVSFHDDLNPNGSRTAAERRVHKPGWAAKVKGKVKGSVKKDKSLSAVLFPGVTPEEYEMGEEIDMYVDLVDSRKTQVPFKFFDLPVCPGPNVSKKNRLRRNIGAKLQGFNYKPSPYPLSVLFDTPCQPLCLVKITRRKLVWLRSLVKKHYRVHMTLDSLPLLMKSSTFQYSVRGYPVGFRIAGDTVEEDKYYLYNHLRFSITYTLQENDAVHITGFTVHPVSIKHGVEGDVVKFDTQIETCNTHKQQNIINDPTNFLRLELPRESDALEVFYSYEVTWIESPLLWADRWDVYLVGSPDEEVHYFAVVNSLVVCFFLTCAIFIILVRTLKKDIAAYNDFTGSDPDIEETGWKLVHGDVFRPPRNGAMILTVCVGTGAQIGVAVILTLASALFGLLSSLNNGETLSSILILYVLSGSVAGYVSSRIYKFCDGKAWKRTTVLTAVGFPGLIFTMFLCLNIGLAFAGAATAVSIWTIISIFLLWICVSTPLVFVGSYFGYRADKIEAPSKTNQIARFIPEGPWYTKTPQSWFICSVLPFGSVSIEVLFIMAAVWLHQIYYAIGFLLFVFIILGLTCAESSVVMNYIQLGAENHQWWWRSFMNCAFTGVFLLLYSLWFLAAKLSLVGFLPVLIYVTYMTMVSIALGLFCGSVGFLACLSFNKIIYGAVKVD